MKHGGDIYSNIIEHDFSVNINPLDCRSIVKEIMDESEGKVCNYPDPFQREFREAIAAFEGVSVKEVFGGSGASELFLSLVALIDPKKVMLPSPCFVGYEHALSIIHGCETVYYQLEEEKDFILDRIFLGALEYEAVNGLELLFLTNPNNPTGKNISKNVLDKTFEICKKYGVKIIVDECFIRLSDNGCSLVSYIKDYDGLFVVNAFTKLFSIPGIRVGYVISNSNNIERLPNYMPEWNLSVVAQTAGIICSKYLKDSKFEDESKQVIRDEREYLINELRNMGYKVYESDTSFILIYSDTDICEYLKEKKVLIRDCSNYKGLKKGFYRIAVKQHEENELLIELIKKMI